MLNCIVRKKRKCTHETYARLQRVPDQFVEPPRAYELDVIVEQDDDRALGTAYAKIAFGGVVEVAGERHDHRLAGLCGIRPIAFL